MKHESQKCIKLKNKIANIGMVLPGSIRTTYLSCGKPLCKCSSKNQEDKHGPYYLWDRKVCGKLSSMSLNLEQRKIVQAAIDNRKKLEKLVQQLIISSAEQYAKQ